MVDPLLKAYATPRQCEIIDAVNSQGGTAAAARYLGINDRYIRSTLQAVRKKAAEQGYEPETGRNYPGPTGHIISGYSELVKAEEGDPLGRIVYWVKTNRRLVDQLDEFRTTVEAIIDELPKLKPVKYTGNVKTKDHFTVIPIGDPHIGLRTWAREVGVDWDVPIAKRVFNNVFSRLFKRVPDTEEAIVFNSGDFFHADNIRGETERSGHKLDLDGRPSYWIEAGVVIMRMIIDMALAKYKKVHFINTPGNHDDILGQALGIAVKHIYENEPRFSCNIEPNPFKFVIRGKVLLGFCHGHTCRLPALPGKMADDQHEAWGKTLYRHWFTGHVHHNQWVQFKEHPGCTVESVGIIPPRDAYAYGAGFGGGRGTQLCIFHRDGYMPDRFSETVWVSD